MLMAERHRRIQESLRARGTVSIRDLVTLLDTSEVTVRRDLSAMATAGLIRRTHGGATLTVDGAYEPSYSEKASVAASEKEAIAQRAAALVEVGDSILIGPGTTTLAFARRLAAIGELTVATNSLLVAQALLDAPNIEVLVTGGTLRRSIHALVGSATEKALEEIKASKAFMSSNGVTAERGLTTPNQMVATADRALAAASRHVVALADSTKVGAETMFQTVPCERLGTLITDSKAAAAELNAIRDQGVHVLIAEGRDATHGADKRDGA